MTDDDDAPQLGGLNDLLLHAFQVFREAWSYGEAVDRALFDSSPSDPKVYQSKPSDFVEDCRGRLN